MPGPFEPMPQLPPHPPLPIAIVVQEDAEAEAYLAAGPVPGPYVVVKTPADVPAKIGGMALVTDRDLGDELRTALLRGLGIPPGRQ